MVVALNDVAEVVVVVLDQVLVLLLLLLLLLLFVHVFCDVGSFAVVILMCL